MSDDRTLSEIRDLLARILFELQLQSIDIKAQNDGLDPTPWPFKLAAEVDSWCDQDGNGLVLGKDFVLAENPNHIPPALLPSFAQTAKRQLKQMTWEMYRDTLPAGKGRDALDSFLASLPNRADRSERIEARNINTAT